MHALTELERAKWRFWNGYKKKGLIGLVHLRQWALAHCFDHIPTLKKLAHALSETIRYLELNADSMPNYGKRYRSGLRISTGFAAPYVNFGHFWAVAAAVPCSRRNKPFVESLAGTAI